jgi:hypothetical protein
MLYCFVHYKNSIKCFKNFPSNVVKYLKYNFFFLAVNIPLHHLEVHSRKAGLELVKHN